MNKPVTELHKKQVEEIGHERAFSVFFKPDKNKEDFELGMMFTVTKVNRDTGEVTFLLNYDELEVDKNGEETLVYYNKD